MPDITEQEYHDAIKAKEAATSIINTYHTEKDKRFKDRLNSGKLFTDDELVYSRITLCPCGHGLAYPKDCGGSHYWDCSAILKGIHDKSVKHTDQLSFAFYDVKSETDEKTSRGVFKPKPV